MNMSPVPSTDLVPWVATSTKHNRNVTCDDSNQNAVNKIFNAGLAWQRLRTCFVPMRSTTAPEHLDKKHII